MTNSTNPKFNPSGKEEVDIIKGLTEELIEYIEKSVPDGRRTVSYTHLTLPTKRIV